MKSLGVIGGVLNLITTGMPSIQENDSDSISLNMRVLNLVISGMPSILAVAVLCVFMILGF